MLLPEDLDTPTWQRLERAVLARLSDHRDKLERPQTDERTGLILRGRIQELKELLALARAPADEASPE